MYKHMLTISKQKNLGSYGGSGSLGGGRYSSASSSLGGNITRLERESLVLFLALAISEINHTIYIDHNSISIDSL